MQHKLSVIKTLTYRALTHNNQPDNLKEDLKEIVDEMILNNYPEQLTNRIINQCKNTFSQQNDKVGFDVCNTIVIPYYRGISEKIKNILSKYNIRVAFRRGLSIKNILMKSEPRTKLDKSNLVYEINCNDCNSVYVGETKRNVRYRIHQHKYDEQQGGSKSNVAFHHLDKNHKINYDNINIAYCEKNTAIRKNLESWRMEHLKHQGINLMNMQQNAETSIPSPYLSLLNKKT